MQNAIFLWERLNNENFNRVEFDPLKNEYDRNSFVTVKYIFFSIFTKYLRKQRKKDYSEEHTFLE